MPASLAEFDRVKMYVIHKMHLAEVFSFGNQLDLKSPPFCAIIAQNTIGVSRQFLTVTSEAIERINAPFGLRAPEVNIDAVRAFLCSHTQRFWDAFGWNKICARLLPQELAKGWWWWSREP
jgi:hypothetical protein